MKREVTVTISCSCNFWCQRIFYTNEYGYFEIPTAYCPNCFHLLNIEVQSGPVDVTEITKIEKEI